MNKFMKYHAFYIALGFIFVSFIQQFYYSEWRGIYVAWGMLFMFLIDMVFDWRNEQKAVEN